jgi:ATP-binding protein involved in chromosome partitioning
MTNISQKNILVLSGKGGVGKSTISANLAITLAERGRKTGLMDVDIHGPSIPKLFGVEDRHLEMSGERFKPVSYNDRLKIISTAFLLENQDTPVIFRGPRKNSMIQQFINDVDWGDLDYLVVDCPPGTGDEPLSVIQTLKVSLGAVVVTTPQELALSDVRKSVSFLKQMKVPILGVIENMSGFVCPHCGETTDIFKKGGGEIMCRDMDVPFLGRIPIDPQIVVSSDEGGPYALYHRNSDQTKIFESIIDRIEGTKS